MANPSDIRDFYRGQAARLSVFMTDAADHVTGKPGLTLDVRLRKATGSFAAITPAVVDAGFGWYDLILTAGNLDTLGQGQGHIEAVGADPADFQFRVVTAPAAAGGASSDEEGAAALRTIILERAGDARSTTVDGVTVSERDLRELVEARGALKEEEVATGSNKLPIRLAKVRPGGAE